MAQLTSSSNETYPLNYFINTFKNFNNTYIMNIKNYYVTEFKKIIITINILLFFINNIKISIYDILKL